MNAATQTRILEALTKGNNARARAYGIGIFTVEAHARACAAREGHCLVMAEVGRWITAPSVLARRLVEAGYEFAR